MGVLGSGEQNLYGYAGNDPVNFADPDGLDMVRNEGIQLHWFVRVPPGAAGSYRLTAGIPIGTRAGGDDQYMLDARFGGGLISGYEAEQAARQVFAQRRDLSGLTRMEQEREIGKLLQNRRGPGSEGRRNNTLEFLRETATARQLEAQAQSEWVARSAQKHMLRERVARAAGFPSIGAFEDLNEMGFDSIDDYIFHLQTIEEGKGQFLDAGYWGQAWMLVQVGGMNFADAFMPDSTDWGTSIAQRRNLLGAATSADDTYSGIASRVVTAAGREGLITAATLGVGTSARVGALALRAQEAGNAMRGAQILSMAQPMLRGVSGLAGGSRAGLATVRGVQAGLVGYQGALAIGSGVGTGKGPEKVSGTFYMNF